MRGQLQALLKELDYQIRFGDTVGIGWIKSRLGTILDANPEPVMRLTSGWIAKGSTGLVWFSLKPRWCNDIERWLATNAAYADDMVSDPWPDKPEGGPECLMEVK